MILSRKTNVDARVLNAIRNEASITYRNYVPVATETDDSIGQIGAILMDYPSLYNEFWDKLVYVIYNIIVASKMYYNHYGRFKKGYSPLGGITEAVFVDLIKVHDYNPEDATTDLYKREIPDIRTAFFVCNYRKYYKLTTNQYLTRTAFQTWDQLNAAIRATYEAVYKTAEYDEEQVFKYMLASRISDGLIGVYEVPEVTKTTASDVVRAIKAVSNDMEFMKTKYNIVGVHNSTEKSNQYLISSADFDATTDVEVLAAAFHMDKAEFMGHRFMIDSFGALDVKRLNELLGTTPGYREFSQDELDALDRIPAILVDGDFFQIWDNLTESREYENGLGLERHFAYHRWQTWGINPFSNAAMFYPAKPTVTGVTVSPSAASLPVGSSIQLKATVNTDNFASKAVTWTSDNENVIVDARGYVQVLAGAVGSATITATSEDTDGSNAPVSNTCEITIG